MASIAAVKIAQKQAGMSDPDYRALLDKIFAVKSCKDLNDWQRKIAVKVLRNNTRSVIKSPLERKVWAMWYALKKYLPRDEQRVAYLYGIIGRIIGRKIKGLKSMTGDEYHKTVEALKLRLSQEEEKGVL